MEHSLDIIDSSVGLSSRDAYQQLITIIDSSMKDPTPLKGVFWQVSFLIGHLFNAATIALIVYYFIAQQKASVELVVSLVLIVIVSMFGIAADLLQQHSDKHSLQKRKLQKLKKLIEKKMREKERNSGKGDEKGFTFVYRDQQLCSLPNALLLRGDLIRLKFGSLAPCKVKNVENGKFYEAGQVVLEKHLLYKVLETRIEGYLMRMKDFHRPESPFSIKMRFVGKFSLFLMLATVITLVLYGIFSEIPWDSFVPLAINALMPLCFLSSAWKLPVFAYCNTRILILLEYLQKSKVSYDDIEEKDEFDDEAPPPTKDLHIPTIQIMRKLLHYGHFIDNTFDVLGNINVLCTADKENVLSQAYSTVDELVLPAAEECVILNIEYEKEGERKFVARIEDKNWRDFLNSVKPIGLIASLHSNAASFCSMKGNVHCNSVSSDSIKLPIELVNCNCFLAREIGFHEDIKSSYISLDSFIEHDDDGKSFLHYSLFKCKESSQVVRFIRGHVPTILEKCDFYWDGALIADCTETFKKKILELNANSVELSDYSPVGFAFSIDNHDRNIFLGMTLDCFEPKEDLCEVIDDLASAGVRFVFFSPLKEQQTKGAIVSNLQLLEKEWD